MTFQFPYAYVVNIQHQPQAIFTWPNIARKYIRDIYTNSKGELKLPPDPVLRIWRYKVNPTAGQAIIIDSLKPEKFLAQDVAAQD